MDLLNRRKGDSSPPVSGNVYISTLHKYLRSNLSRFAPNRPESPSILSQTYTLFTLGLDPSSAPLSKNLKVPLTLGFGKPGTPKGPPPRPIPLRISPDRLLYLLLRWQSLPQALSHVGRTDIPIPDGVVIAASGGLGSGNGLSERDGESIRSWVPSMRSVSLGSADMGGWFRKEEISEEQLLLSLYEIFTVLPALSLHSPKLSEKPIAELIEAGGYTQLGGIDVRVPLDVLRNLQILELDGYDPRGLLIPLNPGLRSLTVRDANDGDDWIEELLTIPPSSPEDQPTQSIPPPKARFPNLRFLCIRKSNLIAFPNLPLTHLAHLDLSRNLLDSLPSSLSSLSNLITLNLSHNDIQSLRNAPSVLGNIATLNLSHNQIDCLVGLERVLGLQRVDVRNNQLDEVSEVGRLGDLPGIKEIWCSGNHFDKEATREDWRVRLGVSLALDNKEVLVDDTPWTWNEKRHIESELVSRGHQAGRGRAEVEHSHRHSENIRQSHSRDHPDNTAAPPNITREPVKVPELSTSPTTSTSSKPQLAQKKRRPRRIIKLDSEETLTDPTNGLKPLRLAASTTTQAMDASDAGSSEDPTSDQVAEIKVRSKGSGKRRSRLSSQTFDPDPGALERLSVKEEQEPDQPQFKN